MGVLSLLRALAALVSAALLVAGAYLLWSWYQGAWVRDPAGVLLRMREDWRLWAGTAFLAWSLLGRFVVPLIFAEGGGRPTHAKRGQGEMIPGASGSSLYVERHGPAGAPAVIFTHGWGMDSTYWDYAKRDLANRFTVVVWDLPGLGRSKPPADRRIALANFATDLAGLLGTLGRPAVLVGHSIGGIAIQTLVRDHPDAMNRVAGVVLLNTTYTNPLKTMVLSRLLLALQKPVLEPLAHLTIWLHPIVWLSKWQSYLSGSTHAAMRAGFGKVVTRSQLEHTALLATRAAPAIEAKGDLAMFHWDASGVLAGLRKPLLVIGGDLDIVTKLEASAEMAAQAPSGTLHVVRGVNHMGPMEQAETYNEAIAAFILSVQPSATRERREELGETRTFGARPEREAGIQPPPPDGLRPH
jgi:pimeloyl-ACP methyl ester carboxylesterase